MLWILLWQRVAYVEGKHRRVGRTKHLCQQASQSVKKLGMAEEGGCAGDGSQPRAALAFRHHCVPARGTPAASVPRKWGPGVEPVVLAGPGSASPGGPLTHRSAGAGPWTPRRALAESGSPGEPPPLPRPPWGGWGVSPPSCKMEESLGGRGGQLKGNTSAAQGCRGRQGKTWAALGVSSPAPCSCPVPSLCRQTLQGCGTAGYI